MRVISGYERSRGNQTERGRHPIASIIRATTAVTLLTALCACTRIGENIAFGLFPEPPLHDAARHGDVGELERLLADGHHIEERNRHGQTPLHVASTARRAHDVVLYLIEHGADVNATSHSGETALHAAARSGGPIIAQALIKDGAHVNAKDDSDNTPLHTATAMPWKRNQGVIDILLGNGAAVDAMNAWGATPLHLAVRAARKDYRSAAHQPQKAAKTLLTYGADVDAQNALGQTPLHVAHHSNADLLLRAGADCTIQDKRGRTPYDTAAARNDQALQELLAHCN